MKKFSLKYPTMFLSVGILAFALLFPTVEGFAAKKKTIKKTTTANTVPPPTEQASVRPPPTQVAPASPLPQPVSGPTFSIGVS